MADSALGACSIDSAQRTFRRLSNRQHLDAVRVIPNVPISNAHIVRGQVA
ncbi:MAG: hypothetical protein ACXWYD_18135 [Candidatus Binatia bacterium]